MAEAAPTVAAVAKAAAATSSESSSSQTADLATGIIVIIAIAGFLFFVAIGFVCFCVRRKRTKTRRAALLATAQANAENTRLSQQNMYAQYPLQESGVYQPQQGNGIVLEMPAVSGKSPIEADGRPMYEALTPPSQQATEMYSPPASGEPFARIQPSTELDGGYGNMPLRPDNDVTSPMLRKDHEQQYSQSWGGARGNNGG